MHGIPADAQLEYAYEVDDELSHDMGSDHKRSAGAMLVAGSERSEPINQQGRHDEAAEDGRAGAAHGEREGREQVKTVEDQTAEGKKELGAEQKLAEELQSMKEDLQPEVSAGRGSGKEWEREEVIRERQRQRLVGRRR